MSVLECGSWNVRTEVGCRSGSGRFTALLRTYWVQSQSHLASPVTRLALGKCQVATHAAARPIRSITHTWHQRARYRYVWRTRILHPIVPFIITSHMEDHADSAESASVSAAPADTIDAHYSSGRYTWPGYRLPPPSPPLAPRVIARPLHLPSVRLGDAYRHGQAVLGPLG